MNLNLLDILYNLFRSLAQKFYNIALKLYWVMENSMVCAIIFLYLHN